jgi:hypothetical protein
MRKVERALQPSRDGEWKGLLNKRSVAECELGLTRTSKLECDLALLRGGRSQELAFITQGDDRLEFNFGGVGGRHCKKL